MRCLFLSVYLPYIMVKTQFVYNKMIKTLKQSVILSYVLLQYFTFVATVYQYEGSFKVQDGPGWWLEAIPVSCIETC